MTARRSRLRDSDSWPFDVGVLALGLAVLATVLWLVVDQQPGSRFWLALVLGAPAVMVVSRFPIPLRHASGRGIEVGLDSSVLIFLLCTIGTLQAVAVWSVGVVLTEVTSGKRPTAVSFNIGVGVLAGGVAGVALHAVRGPEAGTPREMAAVVLAVASYFAIDYVLTGLSLSLDSHTSWRHNLAQGGAALAMGSFVGLNLVGYLGAIVLRFAPWWPVTALVAIPLVTVIVAARAVNRGYENQRRLTGLFGAAVRSQSLSEVEQVFAVVESDARELLRPSEVALRRTAPGPGEIGSQVGRGADPRWVVAAERRQLADTLADQRALDTLAAIAAHALTRLQLTEGMVHFARCDPLTDLPNRAILQDRATHALQLTQRGGRPLALLVLDLDGFKPVNDRFGHAAGDRVLVEVASRLRRCSRGSDTVARLGGDEFAVLLEHIDHDDALALAERILASIATGVVVGGAVVPLSASIGVAFGADQGTTERILRQADLAMYEAKARGSGRVVEYDSALSTSRLQKLERIEALREAVLRRRIEVVYQPVVEVADGSVAGVEALARWRLDDVAVPPDEFIALAEEVGLIVDLGAAVLEQAAGDAVLIRTGCGRPLSMSVNISAQQLRDPSFIDVVRAAVVTMDGIQLILEVTEREGIGGDRAVYAAMEEINALGVLFAIDDFGVGFSAIGYLQDVPAQILKADRALSRNIDRDERACLLLRSIATMARELGMEVVVEGIERDSQLARLEDTVHARFAQGYLMYRPMPLRHVVEALSGGSGPARAPALQAPVGGPRPLPAGSPR